MTILIKGDTLFTLQKSMTSPTLIVLIGLPGTGKSTYRNTLTQVDLIHISSDDYIESYAKMCNSTYDKVFEEVVKHTGKYIDDLSRHALQSKLNVVWDQTNLTVKKRKQILDKFKKYVKVAIYFEIPDDWKSRLSSREGKTIPAHILKNMSESYQEPSLEEGFDLIYKYNNNNNKRM